MAGWNTLQLALVPAVCLLVSLIKGVAGGELCRTSLWTHKYCEYGCCGSYYDEYCCGMNVALIVGCVVGGIFFVAVIVTIVCCVIKKKGYHGRVVGPHAMPMSGPGAGNVTVVHSNNANMGYPPGPPMANAMYGPATYQPPPPPPYGYGNPAYPPPMAGPPPPGGPGPKPGGFAAPATPGYSPSNPAP